MLRTLDAVLGGATLLAILDVGAMALGGARDAPAFGFALCLPIALLGLPAVALVVLTGRAASFLDTVMGQTGRILCAALTATCASIPLVLLVPRVARRPGLPLVMIALALFAVAAWAFSRARRSWSCTVSLVSAALATVVCLHVAGSVALLQRVSSSQIELPIVLVIALVVAGLGLAAAFSRLVSTMAASPGLGGWRSAPVLLLGLTIGGSAMIVPPDLYPAVHQAAYLAALVLMALALTGLRWPGGIGQRVPLIATAVLVTLAFALFLPVPSSAPWSLATLSRLNRELVRETGLARRALAPLIRALRTSPEASAVRMPRRPDEVPPTRHPRSSILLVTIDSLRGDHAGYANQAAQGLTPRLDQLASRSVRFRHAYAQGGWTSLSIPSLLWSRFPKDIRFAPLYEEAGTFKLYLRAELPAEATISKVFQSPIDEPSANLAECLARADFTTIAIPNDGYTNYFDPRLGFSRGFETVVYPKAERGLAIADDAFTAALAVKAIRDLPASERSFLWVHFFDPHNPHGRGAPGESALAGYRSEIAATDRHLGTILDALAAANRAQDTIVVVASDHGEVFSGDSDLAYHGVDLREAAVHVPLVIAIPDERPMTVDAEVGLIDVAPTLLSLAGVPVPPTMQGRSLLPLLREPATLWPPAYLATWRKHPLSDRTVVHQIGAVRQRRKVVLDMSAWSFAFFDLAADPDEKHNLLDRKDAATRREFTELAGALVRWQGL